MKASIVLNPGASKRLIARGVAALPSIRAAFDSGTIVITLGTTNAIVAEELLGESVDRGAFAAGFIDDRFNVNARLGEANEIVIRDGKRIDIDPQELLNSLSAGDVVIKGGNAIDPWGSVGVLMASPTGGTVGRYHAAALARGLEIIIPISLQKTIHTAIDDLAREMGSAKIELCMGLPCGMYPLTGRVVTEIDALETLFPVEVTQISNGGVGRGAGAVSLLMTGDAAAVQAAFDLAAEILASADDDALEGSA
jgi:hypothetical protein